MKCLTSFEEVTNHCISNHANELLIENTDWQDFDWQDKDWQDKDWQDPDWQNQNWQDFQSSIADIPSAALQDMETDVCLFRASVFRNVSFRGVCLTGLAFYQCDFQQCTFDSADLREVVFEHCNFYVSDLDIARRLGSKVFDEEEIAEEKRVTTFKFANLTCTRLSSSDISLCDFTRSKLYRAEIRDCQVQGADFSETSNSHSPGGSVILFDATLVDNNFAYTDFSGATFKDADLSGNRFSHCVFHHASLDGSQLNECDMHAIEAEGLCLTGTDLRGSNIMGLDPRAVDLTGAMINASQQPMLLEALGLIIDKSLDVD